MGTYVQLMPRMVQRRMEEMEAKAAENAKMEAASGAAGTEMAAASSALQAPSISSALPAEPDASVSKSTAASELKISAATNETLNPSVVDKAGIGPSYTAGFPQPAAAGGQIESESSAALFTPSKSTSLSEDASVLTLAPKSKSPPEVPPLSGQ